MCGVCATHQMPRSPSAEPLQHQQQHIDALLMLLSCHSMLAACRVRCTANTTTVTILTFYYYCQHVDSSSASGTLYQSSVLGDSN